MKNADRVQQLLNTYQEPAILVSKDYEILASNVSYTQEYGALDHDKKHLCYAVSHNYTRPCDESGEDCPLKQVIASRHKEHTLHIHESPTGRKYVDVQMTPVFKDPSKQDIDYFIERLKTVEIGTQNPAYNKLVGESSVFKKTLADAMRAAKSSMNILIEGETGSGKKHLAHFIHSNSANRSGAIVVVDCAGLDEENFEHELFGEDIANPARNTRPTPGMVEQANEGTLVLDRISTLPLQSQAKVLHLIETRAFRRAGGITGLKYASFRLICTTSTQLREKVDRGEFRRDLYHRICGYPITNPSLAQRKEDIAPLSKHFLSHLIDVSITQSAISLLKNHHYDGNIIELENILSRACALCDTGVIENRVMSKAIQKSDQNSCEVSPGAQNADMTLKQLEANYLKKLLVKHAGNKEKAANSAGISVRSLYRKLTEDD